MYCTCVHTYVRIYVHTMYVYMFVCTQTHGPCLSSGVSSYVYVYCRCVYMYVRMGSCSKRCRRHCEGCIVLCCAARVAVCCAACVAVCYAACVAVCVAARVAACVAVCAARYGVVFVVLREKWVLQVVAQEALRSVCCSMCCSTCRSVCCF